MKSKYFISVNPLAEFSNGTEFQKRRILKQQKKPNKFLIPWYQKCKGAIKKFLFNISDYSPINQAIIVLNEKIPLTDRQMIDKKVSILALEEIKKVKLPKELKQLDYEVVQIEDKSFIMNDVDIIVAPEVVIKAKINGTVVYGGIKIHISKGKPFSFDQAQYVATSIFKLLDEKVKKSNEFVHPSLCFCLDVFAGRFVSPPDDIVKELSKISIFCQEIKDYWPN